MKSLILMNIQVIFAKKLLLKINQLSMRWNRFTVTDIRQVLTLKPERASAQKSLVKLLV